MRRGLVAANWKMNGLRTDNDQLVKALLAALDGKAPCDVVLCPPSLYIGQVGDRLQGSSLALGAQNCYLGDKGAYTGEISCRMIDDMGCRYVIVGHSERRELFGESDQLVADKFACVLAEGMVPILCVGETREQREAGETEAVVARQLDAVLARSGAEAFRAAVVAYEPVWAIGTGLTAEPGQAQAVHEYIRGRVAAKDADAAERLRILYGGSVKAANADALFAEADIDGALVGGASLIAEEFIAICRSCAR